MAGANGCRSLSCLRIIIGVVIIIVVSCWVGFGVNFGGFGDDNNFVVEESLNNSVQDDQKASVSENTTIDNENEISQNFTHNNVAKQVVENLARPVVTHNDESRISTNVSLANFNQIEIIVDNALKLNQEKYDETVDRIDKNVHGHIQGMSKQILDNTLIIMAIMVSSVLGVCAVKGYVWRKLQLQFGWHPRLAPNWLRTLHEGNWKQNCIMLQKLEENQEE